jgi:uncharacterized protein
MTPDAVRDSSDVCGIRSAPRLAGVGVIGGAVGALLGGGTGTVTVPALARMTELRRATIHGTVTIPNVAVAVVGAGAYTLGGHAVDLRVGVPMMVGGVAGVRWGAQAVKRASDELLRRVFITVLLLAGAKLLTGAAGIGTGSGAGLLPAGARSDMAVVIPLGIVLGTVIGAWSAAMGLGGGLLTVPALALLFGVGLHAAAGTSLVVMLPNSLLSARAHLRQGTALFPLGLRLAAGAVVGAALGVLLASALSARALGITFGVFVLAMAARELGLRPWPARAGRR